MEDAVQEILLKPPGEFSFPFEPYDIQSQFMESLFEALEQRKLGIFESPTGTGKSLSLLCGSLTWAESREQGRLAELRHFVNAFDLEKEEEAVAKAQNWIKAHTDLKKRKEKYFKAKRELDFLENTLARRRKAIERRKKSTLILKEDFAKRTSYSKANDQKTSKNKGEGEKDDFSDLFDEDYALDNNSESDFSEEERENEPEFQDTKVIFASRTHSQLSQFVKELQRTTFAERVTVATLGSRQNLCVNADVLKLKNGSLINERCLDLQKKSKGTKKAETKKLKSCDGCPYFKNHTIDELKKRILSKPMDIEDIVTVGRDEIKGCPYYATRKAAKESQMVLLPYNSILHSNTRESLGLNVKGSVILLDEAHNIIESMSNMYSTQLSLSQLQDCFTGLEVYLKRFMSRFNAKNLLRMKQIKSILKALSGFLERPKQSEGENRRVYTTNEFKQAVGIENQDLYSLEKFCEKSRLIFKIKGYLIQHQRMQLLQNGENLQQEKAPRQKTKPKKTENVKEKTQDSSAQQTNPSGSQSMLAFLEFLRALKGADSHGRIVVDENQKLYKFLQLSVQSKFLPLVTDARSLILAGGTMKPYEEVKEQLFQGFESRVHQFTCDHIIPKNNLLCVPVGAGPASTLFDFTFKSRKSPYVIKELTQAITNMIRIVPGGVVCFLPSYDYEEEFYNSLKSSGSLDKINSCKKIFREPKGGNTDNLLEEYTRHIRNSKNGALLFAVVGGKLSEGINFSDDLGRCVIVVGLPYPNTTSIEIQEKVRFVNETFGHGKGDAVLSHMCAKAVNQSIGRAIRHSNDYAVILLLDQRYQNSKQQALLPNWIQDRLQPCSNFGQVVSSVAKFFAEKKSRKSN